MLFNIGNDRLVQGRIRALKSSKAQLLDFYMFNASEPMESAIGSIRAMIVHYHPENQQTTWGEVLDLLPKGFNQYVELLQAAIVQEGDLPIGRFTQKTDSPLDLGIVTLLRIPTFEPEKHVGRDLLRLCAMFADQMLVWSGGISFDSHRSFTADLYTKGLMAMGYRETKPRWVDPFYYRPFLFHPGYFTDKARFQLPRQITQTEQNPLPVEYLAKATRMRRRNNLTQRANQLEPVLSPLTQTTTQPSPPLRMSSVMLTSIDPVSGQDAAKAFGLLPITIAQEEVFHAAKLPGSAEEKSMFNMNLLRKAMADNGIEVNRRDPAASVREAIAALSEPTATAINQWLRSNRTTDELEVIENRGAKAIGPMLERLIKLGYIKKTKRGSATVYQLV